MPNELSMKHAMFSLALAAACTLTAAMSLAQEQPNAKAVSLATQSNPMTLVLDARDAGRGLMYSHMTIPAKPGEFTIVYPKWIPGEHGPTGPLNDLTMLRVSASGRDLSWRRDKLDFYTFHVDVPSGVSTIDVDYNVVLNGGSNDTMATKNLSVVNWNRDLLYQSNINSHDYYIKASIILPGGWSYGCALPGAKQTGDRVDFETVPLNMFIDSPLDLGRYYKHVALWEGDGTTMWLDAFADKPQDLDFSSSVIDEYKQVAPQAFKLYGSRHWNWYHALLTLSDALGFQGIEHHQSSDNRAPDDWMTNPMEQLSSGDLITHEFSHSWNGKYRRPDDLTTLNFQIPQLTDLLWVYEGMNQYLGDLISFRAKIRDPKKYPEYLASIWAQMDTETGRATTPIIDLTTAAPYYYAGARGEYGSMRRNAGDFYTEGELIWLDADTIIRQQTGGAKSLDDFLHLYSAPALTGPITKTYTREEIEALLNKVAPYDWHGFFNQWVYSIAPHPPSDDLERSGWHFEYNSKPNEFDQANETLNKFIGGWYSLGVNFSDEGNIGDVRLGYPAWKGGLSAGMKVVAVDGQQFSPDVLEYAIKQAQHSSAPITFLVQQSGFYNTYTVDYHGGLKYPHLVRVPSKPDMLGKIMAPH